MWVNWRFSPPLISTNIKLLVIILKFYDNYNITIISEN